MAAPSTDEWPMRGCPLECARSTREIRLEARTEGAATAAASGQMSTGAVGCRATWATPPWPEATKEKRGKEMKGGMPDSGPEASPTRGALPLVTGPAGGDSGLGRGRCPTGTRGVEPEGLREPHGRFFTPQRSNGPTAHRKPRRRTLHCS
ncbi:uncharacterized protein LOC144136481 [Amblyomma americanum]